ALDRLEESFSHSPECELEGFERKRGAALEVPVNPAFLQSRSSHDLGYGRAEIALRVQQVCCTDHDAVAGGFAFLHPASAKQKRDRSVSIYQGHGRAASPLSVLHRRSPATLRPFTPCAQAARSDPAAAAQQRLPGVDQN